MVMLVMLVMLVMQVVFAGFQLVLYCRK